MTNGTEFECLPHYRPRQHPGAIVYLDEEDTEPMAKRLKEGETDTRTNK